MFSKRMSAVRDFDQWLGEQTLRYGAVGCPGNHEFYLEEDERRASFNRNLRILNGAERTVAGLRIWGSAVTLPGGGAFGKSNPTDREKHWAAVPEGIDILITHGPPFGILDHGCGHPELLQAVRRIRPKLHLFGHLHGAYGVHESGGSTFVNAALLGADGDLAHNPMVLDIL
jgi:predicted phosphohydrolase